VTAAPRYPLEPVTRTTVFALGSRLNSKTSPASFAQIFDQAGDEEDQGNYYQYPHQPHSDHHSAAHAFTHHHYSVAFQNRLTAPFFSNVGAQYLFPPPSTSWRTISAFVLDLAFAFGWTPCIAPILAAILTVGAASTTLPDGIALLTIYSLGLGVLFLLSALFTDTLATKVEDVRATYTKPTPAAAVMIVMGIAIMTGYLSAFAFWLLATLHILSSIG